MVGQSHNHSDVEASSGGGRTVEALESVESVGREFLARARRLDGAESRGNPGVHVSTEPSGQQHSGGEDEDDKGLAAAEVFEIR